MMKKFDIRKQKEIDIALHAKMSRRIVVSDKFYRAWYFVKYHVELSLKFEFLNSIWIQFEFN